MQNLNCLTTVHCKVDKGVRKYRRSRHWRHFTCRVSVPTWTIRFVPRDDEADDGHLQLFTVNYGTDALKPLDRTVEWRPRAAERPPLLRDRSRRRRRADMRGHLIVLHWQSVSIVVALGEGTRCFFVGTFDRLSAIRPSNRIHLSFSLSHTHSQLANFWLRARDE